MTHKTKKENTIINIVLARFCGWCDWLGRDLVGKRAVEEELTSRKVRSMTVIAIGNIHTTEEHVRHAGASGVRLDVLTGRVPFGPQRLRALVSGLVEGGNEIAQHPAVVDVPLEKGHVVLFSNNPIWRGETEGSYFLVFNALLNFDQLNAGRKLDLR